MKTIKQIRESRLAGALAGATLGAASTALIPIHPGLAAAGLAATPALTSAGMKLGDKLANYIKKRKKKLEEEGPANNAGGGNIAGIGVGPQGEPGIRPKARMSYKKRNQQGVEDMEDGLALMRRKTPMMEEEIRGSVAIGSFAGNQTFVLPSKKFNEMRMHKAKGKHWRKYIGEDEHGQVIREYARKNPKRPIILQDENTGAMCYARYGGKYD